MEVIENKQLGFKFEFIKSNNDVWCKANDIAKYLGYEIPRKAVNDHIPKKHKSLLSDVLRGDLKQVGGKNEQPHQTMTNFKGALYLLGSSKTRLGDKFRSWMYEDVIPQIMMTGKYESPIKKNVNKMLTYRMETEDDLHKKVINFIRKRNEVNNNKIKYRTNLGELQDTSEKRIYAYNHGYIAGESDLMIINKTSKYSGFFIEFKSPKGTGVLTEKQEKYLTEMKKEDYNILISNDYDEIIQEILKYESDIRYECRFNTNCKTLYKSIESRNRHYKYFHKIE
jgi:prophage antirepressor-like protein